MLHIPRVVIYTVIALFSYSTWGWPPSEDDRKKWLEIIEQGDEETVAAFINDLNNKGEDISKWVNMDIRSLGKKYIFNRPLQLAASTGNVQLAQLLIDNGAVLNGNWQGYTPVHQAVHSNQPEMLGFLLNQGANVDGDNQDSPTPLSAAAGAGHERMVAILLDNGASVHPRRSTGPLLDAAQKGNEQIIRMLLEKGADPNGSPDINPDRPLERAACTGQLAAVKQLVAAGAKVNSQNYLQETPLHSAAEHGHLEVVEYLLQQGANVQGKDPDAAPLSEEELLDRARLRGILLQVTEGEDGLYVAGTPLNRAATNGHIGVTSLLMSHNADVTTVLEPGLAGLQQVYPGNGDIDANFKQYVSLEGWTKFAPQLQSFLQFLIAHYLPSDTPLINQAVAVTTIDIPESVDLYDQNRRTISRIESFTISTDFIKTSNNKERSKALHIRVILTDRSGNRTPYNTVALQNWSQIAAQLIRYGSTHDNTAFYLSSDHELIAHEYRIAPHWSLLGSQGGVELQRVSSTPLKKYWGDAEVKADDVFVEQAYFVRRAISGIETNEISTPSINEANILLFMRWHRTTLARLLLAALREQYPVDSRKEHFGINLVCLGSGSGDDVIACHKALQNNGVMSSSWGLEIIGPLGQVLIDKFANEFSDISESRHCGSIHGDAYNSAELITSCKRNMFSGAPLVVVAEDFLVQQVLPGSYSALKILQQLIQPGIADLVVISGVHHSLVSERTASEAGWSVKRVDIYHSKAVTKYMEAPDVGTFAQNYVPAYILTRMDMNDLMQDIHNRSLRRSAKLFKRENPPAFSTLDLSMLGLANTALEHFLNHDENHKIIQIDLSYSYIEEKNLDRTINLLMGFPSLKFVMASGFESWYPAFIKAMESLGRLKVVQRKDNKYQHELPTLDPATAKLLGHYKTIPNQRVYEPKVTELSKPVFYSTHEHETGYLAHELVATYHNELNQILLTQSIQLQATPKDNHCFFHAVSQQLGLTTPDLQAILINHLQSNQDTVITQFPAFAGDQFDQLITELQQGQWGHAGLARILSWMFNKRVIIFYFNSQTGQVTYQVYNPDGSGTEGLVAEHNSNFPEDISTDDIVLVHNGIGHWLGATPLTPDIDLIQHNTALLNPPSPINLSLPFKTEQFAYTKNAIPSLLAILFTAWQAKLK